jgi:hypothetical protein
MRNIPFNLRMTGIIHSINHNRFYRVCNLDRTHYEDQSLIKQLVLDPTIDHNAFYGLTAGLYKINFGPDEYIMDLPISLYNHEYLFIDSPFQAYTTGRALDIHVNLYKLIGLHDLSDQYTIEDTLNNHMDMVFINGRTIMPDREPTFDNPVEFVSIDDPVYKCVGTDGEESELTINLREPLRSMNNGLKDLMVVNSDIERHHIVAKIGRSIMAASDPFEYLEDYSTDDIAVIYGQNYNVAYGNDPGNIRCTHFKSLSCDDIINTNKTEDGISTVDQEFAHYRGLANGYLIKIHKDKLPHIGTADTVQGFSHMFTILIARTFNTTPVSVEYVLNNYSRRVLLLDEYHFKTYYNKTTFIPADNTTEVSYFYKTLHVN